MFLIIIILTLVKIRSCKMIIRLQINETLITTYLINNFTLKWEVYFIFFLIIFYLKHRTALSDSPYQNFLHFFIVLFIDHKWKVTMQNVKKLRFSMMIIRKYVLNVNITVFKKQMLFLCTGSFNNNNVEKST